jgi:transposase
MESRSCSIFFENPAVSDLVTAARHRGPGNSLIATARPNRSSWARNTSLDPPRPINEVSWDTVNDIAVQATGTIVAADTGRFDGVTVIGVDEHRWAHTRHADGGGYVTVITDLTDVVAGQGPARLLDLVPGRSAAVFSDWLEARTPEFRASVEVVAMDGFAGYKNAATSQVPDAVTVMDPFHVVHLAAHKLDLCRQRIQQDTLGHRGRTGDPLYRVRRTLHTRLSPLTDKQKGRLGQPNGSGSIAQPDGTVPSAAVQAVAAGPSPIVRWMWSTADLVREAVPACGKEPRSSRSSGWSGGVSSLRVLATRWPNGEASFVDARVFRGYLRQAVVEDATAARTRRAGLAGMSAG